MKATTIFNRHKACQFTTDRAQAQKIIYILSKDETCLKILTTLHQNYGLDLEGQGQGQGGQGPNSMISILG